MADESKGEKKVMRLYQVPTEVPAEAHLGQQFQNPSGAAAADAPVLAGSGGLQTHTSHVMVPVEPHLGVLVSMAVCLDHGFGLLPPEQQESTLHDMRKLYDEVVGKGYYSHERDGFYQSFVSVNTREDFIAQSPAAWTPISD